MTSPAVANAATPAPARALVLIEIVTVGLPFCAFKLACAVAWLGAGGAAWLSWPLLALGIADATFNLVNAASVGVRGRRALPVCLLQAIARAAHPSSRGANVGTALDVMVSFALVAVMVGTGALRWLSPHWLALWNFSVVLNVLGAGALRMADALAPARS